MSDRREDDMAAQAWPGYVDILSATVIMFVFFVMVIVVVLYLYTIKFTATVQQRAEQKIQDTIEKSEAPETLGDLDEEKNKRIQEISELEKKKEIIQQEIQDLESKVKQVAPGYAEGREQKVIAKGNEIVVLFSDNTVTLTAESIDSLNAFLEQHKNAGSIYISAGDNPLAVTQTSERQSLLARMLNARNIVIDQGIASDKITIKYVDPEKIENNYNWVKVRVE